MSSEGKLNNVYENRFVLSKPFVLISDLLSQGCEDITWAYWRVSLFSSIGAIRHFASFH